MRWVGWQWSNLYPHPLLARLRDRPTRKPVSRHESPQIAPKIDRRRAIPMISVSMATGTPPKGDTACSIQPWLPGYGPRGVPGCTACRKLQCAAGLIFSSASVTQFGALSTSGINRPTLAGRQIAFECQIPSPASQSFDCDVKGVLLRRDGAKKAIKRGSRCRLDPPWSTTTNPHEWRYPRKIRDQALLIQVEGFIFVLVSPTHKLASVCPPPIPQASIVQSPRPRSRLDYRSPCSDPRTTLLM